MTAVANAFWNFVNVASLAVIVVTVLLAFFAPEVLNTLGCRLATDTNAGYVACLINMNH